MALGLLTVKEGNNAVIANLHPVLLRAPDDVQEGRPCRRRWTPSGPVREPHARAGKVALVRRPQCRPPGPISLRCTPGRRRQVGRRRRAMPASPASTPSRRSWTRRPRSASPTSGSEARRRRREASRPATVGITTSMLMRPLRGKGRSPPAPRPPVALGAGGPQRPGSRRNPLHAFALWSPSPACARQKGRSTPRARRRCPRPAAPPARTSAPSTAVGSPPSSRSRLPSSPRSR